MRAATAEFARLSVLLVLEFTAVFYGADWIAGERSTRLRVNSAWESDIPFFRPAYVGHRGWLGVRLDRDLDWDEVAGIIRDAYRQVAPKGLVATLDAQRDDTNQH